MSKSGSGCPIARWPIAHADIAAHYDAAERFLDVSSLGYGATRWDAYRDLPVLAWDDRHLLHDFTEYTPRPNLGQVHRARLQRDPLLHLVLNATISRVLVEHGRATGVALAGGAPGRVVRGRRVVLAGGGIENARMLMLSDPEGVGLGDGRSHTGRYYQDHPIIRTAEILPVDWRVLQDRFIALHRGGRRLFPKLRLAPDAQRHHGLLDATAVFVHEHDDPARDALRRLISAVRYGRAPAHPIRDTLRSLAAPGGVLRDTYRRVAKGLATGARPTAVWLQLWLEQLPDPASRITLGHDARRAGTATRPTALALQRPRTRDQPPSHAMGRRRPGTPGRGARARATRHER